MDVLDLGRRIVSELGLEQSMDTLGRWMAHHVADLILEAEKANTPAKRKAACSLAEETILRIWSHRAEVTHLNPMADLEPAIKVLKTLATEAPFIVFSSGKANYSEKARQLYDLLRRLTICLSMLHLEGSGDIGIGLSKANSIAEHLSDEEGRFLDLLAPWLDLFPSEIGTLSTKKRRQSSTAREQVKKPDFMKMAQGLLGDIRLTVAELKLALQA